MGVDVKEGLKFTAAFTLAAVYMAVEAHYRQLNAWAFFLTLGIIFIWSALAVLGAVAWDTARGK